MVGPVHFRKKRVLRPWTKSEIRLVKRLYPDHGLLCVCEEINRSPESGLGMVRKLRLRLSAKAKKAGMGKEQEGSSTIMHRNLTAACNRYLNDLRANPPRLTCWLKGNVNPERAREIKGEVEGKGN